ETAVGLGVGEVVHRVAATGDHRLGARQQHGPAAGAVRVLGTPDLDGAGGGAVVLVDGVQAVDDGREVRRRWYLPRRCHRDAQVVGGAGGAAGEGMEGGRDRDEQP